MWLLLGLLGSVTALSVSDLFTAQADEEAEDDRPEEDDDSPRWDRTFAAPMDVGSGYPDELDLDEPDATDADGTFSDGPDDVQGSGPVVEADAPPGSASLPDHLTAPEEDVMGQFDELGLRVHSSDLYAQPDPVVPVTLEGDDLANHLRGTALSDSVFGGAGDDILAGLSGDDWLYGGVGADSLIGGEGNDTLSGGTGADTLVGGAGDDLLLSGGGGAVLMAGDGNDTLIGHAGASFLNGGAGDDLLQAGGGNQLHGGAGHDQFGLDAGLAFGPAHILDFSPEEDVIQLRYNPALGVPELSITFALDMPELAQIRLGDQVLATVANAATLTPDDIALIAVPAADS